MRNIQIYSILAIIVAGILLSCSKKTTDSGESIAVFIPGVLEGSPTYEMMDIGVRKAAKTKEVKVKTIEGGFDQADWYNQIRALAAEGRYKLIVTSNPAMSEICALTADSFPNQDFLVLDGSGEGGPTVTDVVYNHLEQGFLAGYFAGLVTTSNELVGANSVLKVGMIVGQEYPHMNQQILPGYEIGLHTANPDIELEFRVLGNWYDADRARELAERLYMEGVDIILSIAGGANVGVVAAAKKAGAYVLWFDSEGTHTEPGTVLASAVIAQDKAAEEWTMALLSDEMERGSVTRVGVAEGYVDFPLDIENLKRHVPENIRLAMAEKMDRMLKGSLNIQALR